MQDTDYGRVVLVQRRQFGFDVFYVPEAERAGPLGYRTSLFVGMIVLEKAEGPRGGWWPLMTGELPHAGHTGHPDAPPPYPRAHDAIAFLAGVGRARHEPKEEVHV